MWPQSLYILVGCLTLCLPFGGCDSGKSYPTAPAPPTIKGPLPMDMKPAMKVMKAARDDDDLDDDDDYVPARPPSRKVAMIPMNLAMKVVTTLNGHPEGPSAEVFTREFNKAYVQAMGCVIGGAAPFPGNKASLQLRVTVVQSGRVEEVTVLSGPRNKRFRQCVAGCFKRLTVPRFKGPKIVRTLPVHFLLKPAATP